MYVRDQIIAPRSLPDGRIEWEPQTGIVRKLREGDPTMGWEGDPTLSLVLNLEWCRPDDGAKVGRWEVWRQTDDGGSTLICGCPRPTGRAMAMPGNELIRALMRHDSRHVDVGAQVLAENDAVLAARRRAAREHYEATADKLHHALNRDLDNPAPAGRLYRIGS